MTDPKSKRRWFRIHLLTAVLMMVAAEVSARSIP